MLFRKITCIRCGQQGHRSTRIRDPLCIPCLYEHRAESKHATAQVTKAKNRGQLPRADACQCVDCGRQARDYDHRDYTKPLEVVPVCHPCNLKRGIALDSRLRSIPERTVA